MGLGAGAIPLCQLPCGWGWRGTGTALPAHRLKIGAAHPRGAAPWAGFGISHEASALYGWEAHRTRS